MQRRKFLATVGSLAAGSAAAMGTGAFTSATVRDRPVEVSVVTDDEGLVVLSADPDDSPNSEYAEINDDDKLQLVFEGQSTPYGGGEGLNTDSEFRFDKVFSIGNGSPPTDEDDETSGPVATFEIDKSGLDNRDAFKFYGNVGSDIQERIDESNGLGISPGTDMTVDVVIDVPADAELEDEWETGEINIKAERDA